MESNYDDYILNLLNKYLDAAQVEAHTQAMINLIVDQCLEKVLGKNFKKERISRKKQKKVHDMVLREFRKRYGPLINIQIINMKKWIWSSNFEFIFKTNLGRLYSCLPFNNLFFTSHCLERWDERVAPEKYKEFSSAFHKKYLTYPTSLDILNFLITIPLQYGMVDPNDLYRYLNINQGCIVLEVLGEVVIAKTFLSHEMIPENVTWYDFEDPMMCLADFIEPGEQEVPFLKSDTDIKMSFAIWFLENLG